jgi:hypothetical protein
MAPISLVQSWVQDAYDELAGKGHWGWLKTETILAILAQRTVSTTFTNGSTAITSAAGFVVATDPGRQIRVGTAEIYTINTVSDTSNAVLTAAWQGANGAQSANIHTRYLTMPANFRSIYDLTDLSVQRPVAWWISRDRLDLWDPARTSSDTRFRVLASYFHSDVTSLVDRVRYEAWPQPTAAGNYLLQYFKRSDTLADGDSFKGVLATKAEVIQDGALARAARWPGLEGRKNPYFNLALSDRLQSRFELAAQTLQIMDDDQYLESLQQIDLSRYGLAALSADTTLMRQSDATLADYFGG